MKTDPVLGPIIRFSDRQPPNDYDYPCYIVFVDGHEARSDGGTVHDCVRTGLAVGWREIKSVWYKRVGRATLVFGLPLQPCPCCGAEGAYIQLRDLNGHRPVGRHDAHTYVTCCGDDECGMETGRCDTPEDAAKRWNRRTAPEEWQSWSDGTREKAKT